MVLSQGSGTSGNVGFPDYSKVKTIIFSINNSITRDRYRYWPNLTFISENPYIVPEDGWIITARTSASYSDGYWGGEESSYKDYDINWYVNGARVYNNLPFPCKKGDSIKPYNTYSKNYMDAFMVYAPNRK